MYLFKTYGRTPISISIVKFISTYIHCELIKNSVKKTYRIGSVYMYVVEAEFMAINCVESQLWKMVYITSIFMPSCRRPSLKLCTRTQYSLYQFNLRVHVRAVFRCSTGRHIYTCDINRLPELRIYTINYHK
jgi:hypothetical protein